LRIAGENPYVDALPGEHRGLRLNLLRTPAGYVVAVAGQSCPARHTLSELFQDAEMEITEAALARLRQRYLPLHAAAVARRGAGLLVIGGPRRRKNEPRLRPGTLRCDTAVRSTWLRCAPRI
jgi:hypothetical protein